MGRIDYTYEYDKTDPISIETYSQRLVGKTFRQIMEEDEIPHEKIKLNDDSYGTSDVTETKRNKGNLGQIIESIIMVR